MRGGTKRTGRGGRRGEQGRRNTTDMKGEGADCKNHAYANGKSCRVIFLSGVPGLPPMNGFVAYLGSGNRSAMQEIRAAGDL